MERMAEKVTLLLSMQIINNVIVPILSGGKLEPYQQFLCTLPFVSACFLAKYLMVKPESTPCTPASRGHSPPLEGGRGRILEFVSYFVLRASYFLFRVGELLPNAQIPGKENKHVF